MSLPDIGFGSKTNHDQLGGTTYPRYMVMYAERKETSDSTPTDEDPAFGFRGATTHTTGTDAKVYMGILNGVLPTPEHNITVSNLSAGIVGETDRITVKPGIILNPIAQGSAPAVAGSLIYNTSTGELNYHDSSGWNIVSAGGLSAHVLDSETYHTATGLTVGWVISADSATTFSWKAPAGGTDDDAIHDNVANEITAITPKTTLGSTDEFVLEDGGASFVKKAVTFANIESSISLANLGTRAHSNLSDAPTTAHQDEASVTAVPLTISGQAITFNYNTNHFKLTGNNLEVGTDTPGTDEVLTWSGSAVVWSTPSVASHGASAHTGDVIPDANQDFGGYNIINAGEIECDSIQKAGFTTGVNHVRFDGATNCDHFLRFRGGGSTVVGVAGTCYSLFGANHWFFYVDRGLVEGNYPMKIAFCNSSSETPDPDQNSTDIITMHASGDVSIDNGDLTAANIITAGDVDGVDVSEEPARISTEIDTDISTHAGLPNAHHAQSHTLAGSDHTATGLTVGWIIAADSSTTFSWQAPSGGVSGTQWTLPVFDTTSSLGDSMVAQDSGGTLLTVAGDLEIEDDLYISQINAVFRVISSVTNKPTSIRVHPTGTEDSTSVNVCNAADTTNTGMMWMMIDGTVASIGSFGAGTGTAPTTLNINDADWNNINIGDASCTVTLGDLNVTTLPAGAADYDKFLVSDGGEIKFRTGTEVASDIDAMSGSGTQWTLPVFDTTTTLGDSMITQNSAGTAAVVNGDLTVSSLTFTSAVFGTYIPYKVANTGIAPITMSQFQSLRRGVLQTLHPLTGEKDHFYLIDKQSAWTIGSTGGTPSGENNMFNNQLDSNCLITVADLPYVLTITHSGTITATDVLYLEILGHRLSSGAFTLKEWKVEVRETAGSVWWTVLDRSGVTDPPNIAVPLWIIGMDGVDYKYIDGIRLTITSADGSSWAPLEIYLAKLALINTRPSGTPAQAIGALDIVGGTVYGNVTIIGGDLTAANIVTAGTVDGVDVSDFKTAYDAHDGGDVETYHTNYYTDTDVEGVITAEIVDGQSIDNAIDSLISTHDVAGAHILWEDSAAGTIHTDNYLEYTDAAVESVITAELVDGQSIDNAIDGLISTHAGDDDAHHAVFTSTDFTTAFAAESLANLTTRAHSNLSDAPTSAHHVRYADSEVQSVITAELVNGQSIDLAIDSLISTHNVADNHIAHSGVSITAGTGLSGGGTIAATRTINCDITQYTNAMAVAAVQAANPLILTNDLTITGGNLGIGIAADSSYLIESIDGNYLSRLGRTQIGHATYTNYAAFCYRGMSGAGQYALLQNSLGSTYLNAATGQTVYFGVNHVTEMNLTSSGLQMQAAGARVDEFSTDVDLAGNSDVALVTEKAIKTYVDAATGGPGSGTPWDLPVWDTTTTLGDSMISQDSGGTLATVGGALTVSGALKAGGDGFDVDASGNIVDVTMAAATVDTDKFVVQDGSQLKTRTGAQLLNDIGAGGTQKVGPTFPPRLQDGAAWSTFHSQPVIHMPTADTDCMFRLSFRVPDEWPTGGCDLKIMYTMTEAGTYSGRWRVSATEEGGNWVATGGNVLDDSTAYDFPTGTTNQVYIKTIALSDVDIVPGCSLGVGFWSDASNTPALYIMEMWIEP